ncbi:MAG: AAA family ATPase [Polynucleobacter sp.]|nr:AAA family ATPase [Polynucleobacter sp.]
MDNSPRNTVNSYSPPAASWVRFLRSYGPTPNNLNLFDEYITNALSRAKVKPITLTSPKLAEIKSLLDTGWNGSIVIAGTAGDGKTYHCRSLWSHLGGAEEDWADTKTTIKSIQLSDGRKATFIKDLSELNDQEGDSVLEILERSVVDGDDSHFVIMAANHGQILERMRDFSTRKKTVYPLRKLVQDAFLLYQYKTDRLAIFDLSRASHRDSLSEVITAVTNHPEWQKCSACELNQAGRICPILENRNRLSGQFDGGLFANRLGDLVEIARLNGWHLPVRDLLALVSNIILGHKEAGEGLLSCSDVSRLQEIGAIERGNVYGNVFGANLPRRRYIDRPVFKALLSFGIGYETTNAFDGLLVYGESDPKLAETFQRLIGQDPLYGATQYFLSSLEKYVEGEEEARVDGGASDFIDMLEMQRRRLFFTIPPSESDYPYWGLTVYHYAGDYLELIKILTERKAPSDRVRALLIKGLNRVMTGLLIENTDKVFVASSGGYTQSKVSALCEAEAPARRLNGIGTTIKFDPQTEQAFLEIALAPGESEAISLNLSPVRFEFLCRVGEGALPASFSNERLEDLLAFKAKLLRRAERLRVSQSGEDEYGFSDNALTLNFIEIEQNGHGFSKPVTLRIN